MSLALIEALKIFGKEDIAKNLSKGIGSLNEFSKGTGIDKLENLYKSSLDFVMAPALNSMMGSLKSQITKETIGSMKELLDLTKDPDVKSAIGALGTFIATLVNGSVDVIQFVVELGKVTHIISMLNGLLMVMNLNLKEFHDWIDSIMKKIDKWLGIDATTYFNAPYQIAPENWMQDELGLTNPSTPPTQQGGGLK